MSRYDNDPRVCRCGDGYEVPGLNVFVMPALMAFGPDQGWGVFGGLDQKLRSCGYRSAEEALDAVLDGAQ